MDSKKISKMWIEAQYGAESNLSYGLKDGQIVGQCPLMGFSSNLGNGNQEWRYSGLVQVWVMDLKMNSIN